MLEDKRLDKDVPIPLYFQLEKLILEAVSYTHLTLPTNSLV